MCNDRRRWYRCCARSNVHARALMAVSRRVQPSHERFLGNGSRKYRNVFSESQAHQSRENGIQSARTTVCDSWKYRVFYRFSVSQRRNHANAKTPKRRDDRFLKLKSRAVGHRPRRVRPADAGEVSWRGVPALRVGCPSKAASQWTPHPRVRSSPRPRHAHHDQGRRVEEHRG